MKNLNTALILIGLAGIAYAADPAPTTQPTAAADCCSKGGMDAKSGMGCMAMGGMMGAKHGGDKGIPSTQPTTVPSDEHAAHHH